MRLDISSMTHVGRKRGHNEDAFFTDPELGLCVVCDGLGGVAAGEVASRMACDILRRFFEDNRARLRQCAEAVSFFHTTGTKALLAEAAQLAHQAIRGSAAASKERNGMACTMVMLLALGEHVAIAHVGDSRAYLHRKGRLYALTRDHNYAIEAVHSGNSSLQELMHSDKGARLTRCLGYPTPAIEIDVLVLEPMEGDSFLLCSDGVTTHLDSDELLEILECEKPAHVPDALVAECNACGGTDNITAVVALVSGRSPDSDARLASRIISFRGIPVFSRLGLVELMRVFNLCQEREYAADEPIIREGDDDHRLFVCLSGHAQVRKNGNKIASIRPNDVFGEMSLLENVPRSADVVADKPTVVLVFERDNFVNIMRQEPWMAIKMLFPMVQNLNRRLRRTNDKLSQSLLMVASAGAGSAKSSPAGQAQRLVAAEDSVVSALLTEDQLLGFETALYGAGEDV